MTCAGYGKISCDDALLRSGFVQVPLLVLQAPEMGAGAKLTYGVLLWYLWKEHGYPGHQLAAEEFGIPERSLKRYLTELEAAGLIEVHRPGLGETNSYHLPDPRAILAHQGGHIGLSSGPNRPAINNNSLYTLQDDNDPSANADSLSLAIKIAEQYTTSKQDHKALTTSLRKYGVNILHSVEQILQKRVAHGDVENPAAYANRLAHIFVQAQRKAEAMYKQEEQELFNTILNTAAFESRAGRSPKRLRKILLRYWPDALELVEKVIQLVCTE